MKKVAVIGAKGRMGATVCQAILAAEDLELVAQLDVDDQINIDTLNGAEVAVEFTNPKVSQDNVSALLAAGVDVVIGTSGWSTADRQTVASQAKVAGKRVLLVPNFALSAVLVMSFAQQAAKYFTNVEIIETHHPKKLDAPSGTAVATAELVTAAREAAGMAAGPDATESDPLQARGGVVGQVPVHSIRMTGANAHQEVVFGNPGEQLVIRTDCFDRDCFMPGVLLAVREVGNLSQPLTVGLDQVM